MKTNGVVVAAGLSSRMKEFKPLLPLQGKTMIEQSVDSMFKGGAEQVVVVVGYRGDEVAKVLRDHYPPSQLVVVYNHQYAQTDMLTSVKIGIGALAPCEAFYLLPADMPGIHSSTFQAIYEAMVKSHALVVFPTLGGYRKHPPLISWQCIPKILSFTGEGGLRGVWQELMAEMIMVPVADHGCSLDADTPLDYDQLVNHMGLSFS